MPVCQWSAEYGAAACCVDTAREADDGQPTVLMILTAELRELWWCCLVPAYQPKEIKEEEEEKGVNSSQTLHTQG